ncbi:MAG: acylase [Candidatus Aminicenantes bacterium]|nr:acylase [Candidatus Aminicenantes bacterium]
MERKGSKAGITVLLIIIFFGSCDIQNPTEILWDIWGVPHIFGRNTSELFYAYGWAQMHSHADAILKAFGEARGRAAEYWGRNSLPTDKLVHLLGIPERSQEWFDAQSPEFQDNIASFVKGMNDYANTHPGNISRNVECVLPIDKYDIMAHLQYIWHLIFLGGRNFAIAEQRLDAGSNAWAIGPSRSASGHALLLSNPHLSWGGYLMWFESHLVSPELNAYGANILGMPFQIMGFNDDIGWTNTVNTIDGADLFELSLVGEGYSWDGDIQDFAKKTAMIKVREEDGTLTEESLEIRSSLHGPVISQKGDKAIAIRIAGLDQPYMIEQLWQIKKAKNLSQFEKAVSRLQVPLLNFLYADREGHIMYLFGGRTPKRSAGDWEYWSGIVPGDSSAGLWTETLPYQELPKVIDPPSGWLQNANDPPWYCTFPQMLDPNGYPRYLAPQGMHLRAQSSAKILMADEQITFEEFTDYKMSTRVEMAERILDDLIPAVRRLGGIAVQGAADVLETWDRKVDAGSRGAVLFNMWVQEMENNVFAVPWSPDDPLHTPDGLADPKIAVKALEKAARNIEGIYGALDVPWGQVSRLRYAGVDLPANGGYGGLGVFSVLTFVSDSDHAFKPVHGEGYVALIEFGDTVSAKVLMTYGNASQPGSNHRGDQLELFLKRNFRTAWRTRREIEANLEHKESFSKAQIGH